MARVGFLSVFSLAIVACSASPGPDDAARERAKTQASADEACTVTPASVCSPAGQLHGWVVVATDCPDVAVATGTLVAEDGPSWIAARRLVSGADLDDDAWTAKVDAELVPGAPAGLALGEVPFCRYTYWSFGHSRATVASYGASLCGLADPVLAQCGPVEIPIRTNPCPKCLPAHDPTL